MARAKSWLKKLSGGSVGGRNFVVLTIGQTVFAAASWGTLSALALLGSAEDVGELAFALAIVTPTFAMSKLRLRSVVATDVNHEYPKADYVVATLAGAVVSIPIALAVSAALGATASLTAVVAWVALSRAFESMSHVSYGFQQRTDLMTPIGISVGARGLVSMILAAAAFAWSGSVAWAGAGIALGHAVPFFLYDLPYLRPSTAPPGERWAASWPSIRRLTVAALPLGLFAFLMSLSDNIPRLVLGQEWGLAELGVFASFGYVVTGVTAVTRALDSAASPRIARALARRDLGMVRQRIRGLTMVASLIGAFGLALAVTIGAPFLDLAFGPEFAAYSTEFAWMAVYGWMVLVFAGWTVTLVAARRFKEQMYIQIATVLTVLLSGFALIPSFGLMGAVGSLLAGGLVRLVLTASVIRRVIRGVPEMVERPGVAQEGPSVG
jgi:O-antigen/teichoic acid export membrane protein